MRLKALGTLLYIRCLLSLSTSGTVEATASVMSANLKRFLAVIGSGAALISQPSLISATPLGEHTVCAYPACTSQIEILEAAAPGLVPDTVKESQLTLLKDVQYVISELPKLAENKDYEAIRNSLRVPPASSLRLTARKVRNYVEPSQLNLYKTAYDAMIDKVDDIDVFAQRLEQKYGSERDLEEAVDGAVKAYAKFLETIKL